MYTAHLAGFIIPVMGRMGQIRIMRCVVVTENQGTVRRKYVLFSKSQQRRKAINFLTTAYRNGGEDCEITNFGSYSI
jgi:hypothetical protein